MTKAIYIASSEGGVGKSTIALGLVEAFAQTVKSVGVFRPLVRSTTDDIVTRTLTSLRTVPQAYDDAIGVDYETLLADPDAAMKTIISRYEALRRQYDAIVIVGSDYADVSAPIEMHFNAKVAANLNAPVLLAVRGKGRSVEQVKRSAEVAVREFSRQHNTIFGIIATRIDPSLVQEARMALADVRRDLVTGVLPETTQLAAPTVGMQFKALGAKQWTGSNRELNRESLGILIGGMTLPHMLDKMKTDHTFVMPADRFDLLPAMMLAHANPAFPNLAGVILTGGYEIPENVRELVNSIDAGLPIGIVEEGAYKTVEKLTRLEGTRTSSAHKLELSRKLFTDNINAAQMLDSLERHPSTLRTPLAFENEVMAMARSDLRTIVLPEATDDRILQSAATILERGVARIILLGDPLAIQQRARDLDINLSNAKIVNPSDDQLVNKFATEYARLRAKKGVTFEAAKEKLKDLSYFGTMMVHFGMADGMVSGAVNTTANTIRPSLEFIKTKPGVGVVSSSFLMCMPDRVLVMGDCAVNPNPTAEQLADIAISSAQTAKAFGIEPRVAMLSYSSGDSGSGEDVDTVREATRLVKERAPELVVEGPIQFDTAIDPVVGKKKMPGSPVAGQATVFVFPDLNTGNNTYKAIQRTAGATAVGPVLQGLNCPVNDLSRGALVDDIVNTVAITAIQAQETPAGSGSPLHQAEQGKN